MRGNTLGLPCRSWRLGLGFGMLGSFWVPTEYITIIGLGVGAMVIMAPAQVLKKVFRDSLRLLKAFLFKKVYADLFMAMYEPCWDAKTA